MDFEDLGLARHVDAGLGSSGISRSPNASHCSRESQISLTLVAEDVEFKDGRSEREALEALGLSK
jgi:hypothetical protein